MCIRDRNPVNPFDLWAGANFKLKIRKVEGYRNYDKSEFDKPEPLSDDDAELEKIWKSEHPLSDFLKEEHFKPYDELKVKLYRVLALDGSSSSVQNASFANLDEDEVEAPKPQKTAKAASSAKESAPWDSDEDEDLDQFKALLND